MLYHVFLDTNIYDGAAYSFRNAAFQKMREYASRDELVLVTNAVVDGEVRSHIKGNIAKAVKGLNKALGDRHFALFKTLSEYAPIFAKQEEQAWISNCVTEYESLLRDCKAEHITVSDVSVDKLLDDYFHQNLPFETSKPEEFKDAIAAASLVQDINRVFADAKEAVANKEPDNQDDIIYCIVSNDKGFRGAIRGNCNPAYLDYVRVFDDLNKFLDYISMMDRQAQFLKAYLLSEYGRDEMETTVKEAMENTSLDIELESGAYIDEQDCIGVQDITFIPYILGIFEEDGQPLMAKVSLEVECTVEVWYRYTDENNSYYDKEDQAYLWKSEVEKEGYYKISMELVVSLDIGDCVVPDSWCVEEGDFDYSGNTIEFNDYLDAPAKIELYEDDLVEEEVLSKNDPFLEYEEDEELQRERAYSQCPDCGSPINRINDGGNGYCINCALNH